jgi:hypothetical protein
VETEIEKVVRELEASIFELLKQYIIDTGSESGGIRETINVLNNFMGQKGKKVMVCNKRHFSPGTVRCPLCHGTVHFVNNNDILKLLHKDSKKWWQFWK